MRFTRFIRLNRRSQILVALSTTIFTYAFATSIMQYNLSFFTASLSSHYTIFGIVMGLPWFFSIFTDVPAGALADRFGRRKTIILGLVGMAFSGLLMYRSTNLYQIFGTLVLFGLFEGFLTVAGMASVIAISPPGREHQFVGGYQNASGLGYFIGPAVAGFVLLGLGTKIPFLVFSLLCLVGALIAYASIRMSGGKEESFAGSILDLVKKDRVYLAVVKEFFSSGRLAYLVSFSMLFIGMWTEFIWAMEPLLVRSLHSSYVTGGIILSAFVLPVALLDYPIGRWIDKTQKRYFSILGGLIAGGMGVILFSLVRSPVLLILLAFLVSLGFAFFYVAVNGLFDSLSNHHRRGYMAGVWQGSEDVGFVLGPVLGGIAADFLGLHGSFMAFGAVFFLSALWVMREKIFIKRCESR